MTDAGDTDRELHQPSVALSDHAPSSPPARISTLRSYIQLLRLPAVFTALADIFLGFLLTHGRIDAAPTTLGLLLVTSAALYLAGMVFNDVFDLRIDTIERPKRPIPSGRISLRAATTLGSGLVLLGLGSAATLCAIAHESVGWNPLLLAGLIVAAIFLYDAGLKSTAIGPVSMGLCRFLNVLLGASAGGAELGRPFELPQIWIASGLTIYVAGVTWFARTEATESRRGSLFGALLVINAGIATLMGWVRFGRSELLPLLPPFVLLAIIALTINRRMLAAITTPTPGAVQATVRTLLLTIITLDAAIIFAHTNNILLATTIAAGLILPAILTARAIRIT